MVIKFSTHDELDTTLVWLRYCAPKIKGQGHGQKMYWFGLHSFSLFLSVI